MSGRARDNRLVHFTPHAEPRAAGSHVPDAPRPGDVVTVTITRAAPHYLLSDAPPRSLRRTRAGDAWEAGAAAPGVPPADAPVLLGMPALGPTAR
jgi:tRNA-2-methylthio-N6-dimethylallyladenosine synthase